MKMKRENTFLDQGWKKSTWYTYNPKNILYNFWPQRPKYPHDQWPMVKGFYICSKFMQLHFQSPQYVKPLIMGEYFAYIQNYKSTNL